MKPPIAMRLHLYRQSAKIKGSKDYFVTLDKYLMNDSVTANYEECTVLSINFICAVQE